MSHPAHATTSGPQKETARLPTPRCPRRPDLADLILVGTFTAVLAALAVAVAALVF